MLFGNVNVQTLCHANTRGDLFFVTYEILCDGREIKYTPEDFEKVVFVENSRKEILTKNKNRIELIQKIESMGIDKESAIKYVFPELEYMCESLTDLFCKKPEKDEVLYIPNKCELSIKKGKNGYYFRKEKFFEDVLTGLKKSSKIKVNLLVEEDVCFGEVQDCFVEKGCFLTNFSTSGNSRKNNIKKALCSLDGIVLDVGEVFSFNTATGKRTEKEGYSEAKIISGGTYVSGFGGGVCQVSTTLYNACLLAGLEIIEVNPHSLPVSYIEPCFDAMVNTGSSDFVFRNNTDGKIIITTSSKNDFCKIKIFGKPNKYKIERVSEKIKTIPAEKDDVDTDFQKYNISDLQVGEERRISFAKDGFESVGYIKLFDQKGNFVKTQKIRQNKYNPTKGIVVKREK